MGDGVKMQIKPALLNLDGIRKSFGAVHALKGVSFDLHRGEVHALLGENGAGKSTLIQVITGAHRPDAGSMSILGETVGHLTPARAHLHGIAAIYQRPALFPDLSVAENIALGLEKHSAFHLVKWPARRARARELLQRIGANIDPGWEVRHLSMPEQQLVEIALSWCWRTYFESRRKEWTLVRSRKSIKSFAHWQRGVWL